MRGFEDIKEKIKELAEEPMPELHIKKVARLQIKGIVSVYIAEIIIMYSIIILVSGIGAVWLRLLTLISADGSVGMSNKACSGSRVLGVK